MKTEAKSNNEGIRRYDTVLSFLALEILALACFGLGSQYGLSVFRVFGVFVAIGLFAFVKQNADKENRKLFLLETIPFALLFLLMSISRFFIGGGNAITSLLVDISVFAGLIAFFVIGYSLKSVPSFKREYIVLAILIGLGAYVLICGIYSFARYGFLYSALYKGKYYYFDGITFPIWTETKVLNGFSFAEAALSYGAGPAVLLSSSGVGCFFINPKKDKKRFFILLGFALLGLLYLCLVPYLQGIVVVVAVAIFFGIFKLVRTLVNNGKFKENNADLLAKILFICFVTLVIGGVIILFIDAFTNSIFSKIPYLAASRSGGKLCDIAEAIRAPFIRSGYSEIASFDFVGFLFGTSYSGGAHSVMLFEINVLWECGFPAFLLLILVILAMFPLSRRFLLKDGGPSGEKVAIVALLLTCLVYFTFFDSELPLPHGSLFIPFSRSGIILMCAFLCGHIFEPIALKKKKEASDE